LKLAINLVSVNQFEGDKTHSGCNDTDDHLDDDADTDNPRNEMAEEKNVVVSLSQNTSAITISENQDAGYSTRREETLPSLDSAPSLSGCSYGSLEQKASLVPGAPDFLMSYSTLPGSISYRHPVTGSLYIQALANNLKQNIEIDRALKNVTVEVERKLRKKGELDSSAYQNQLPFHLTTGMSKLLYLASKDVV